MSKMLFIIVFLLYLCLPIQLLGDEPCTHKALLVGVGSYPEGSGWNRISSARDVAMLNSTLYPTFRTRCLVDEQANHEGIIRSLDSLCIEVNAGDTVLVHFSCHGQQILTTSQEEPDHLDEALVPYDALPYDNGIYHGEQHLRDDELGQMIMAIRQRMAGKGLLIVSLDACHSGNSIRGSVSLPDSLCRGINDIFGVDPLSEVADSLEIIRYARDTTELSSDGAPVVFVSACQSTEKNYEYLLSDGSRVGALSYSLNEAILETGMKDINVLLDSIYSKMKKYGRAQTPQFKSSFGYMTPSEGQDLSRSAEENRGEEGSIYGKILKLAFAVVALLLVLLIYGRRRDI